MEEPIVDEDLENISVEVDGPTNVIDTEVTTTDKAAEKPVEDVPQLLYDTMPTCELID